MSKDFRSVNLPREIQYLLRAIIFRLLFHFSIYLHGILFRHRSNYFLLFSRNFSPVNTFHCSIAENLKVSDELYPLGCKVV
jgi:hypothetical protein